MSNIDDFENNNLKIYMLRIYTRQSYKFLIGSTTMKLQDEFWKLNIFNQCHNKIIPIHVCEIRSDNKYNIFKDTIFENNKIFEINIKIYYQWCLFLRYLKSNQMIIKNFISNNYHISIDSYYFTEMYDNQILTRDDNENIFWNKEHLDDWLSDTNSVCIIDNIPEIDSDNLLESEYDFSEDSDDSDYLDNVNDADSECYFFMY